MNDFGTTNAIDVAATAARSKGLPSSSRAAWVWSTVVVGFLILQLVLGFSAIALSQADPTVAVVPDYYQKSLDWDETKSRLESSRRLGWQVRMRTVDAVVPHAIELSFTDQENHPIAIGRAEVVWFHHARASDVGRKEYTASRERESESADLERGTLTIPGLVSRPGLWTLDVDITTTSDTRFAGHYVISVSADDNGQSHGAAEVEIVERW